MYDASDSEYDAPIKRETSMLEDLKARYLVLLDRDVEAMTLDQKMDHDFEVAELLEDLDMYEA